MKLDMRKRKVNRMQVLFLCAMVMLAGCGEIVEQISATEEDRELDVSNYSAYLKKNMDC